MLQDQSIDAGDRRSPDKAVGKDQTIEGITGPTQGDRRFDQRPQWRVIEEEAAIGAEGVEEFRSHVELPHLRVELDFQERDGGETPRQVLLEPTKARELPGPGDDPAHEVSVEEGLQRLLRSFKESRPSPDQVQDHRSASSTFRPRISLE